jgi:hypothetical protein
LGVTNYGGGGNNDGGGNAARLRCGATLHCEVLC